MPNLKAIYEGQFKDRVNRFDDGGSYISYYMPTSSAPLNIDASGGGFNDTPFQAWEAPSANLSPSAAFDAANAQIDPSLTGINPDAPDTTASSGKSSGAASAAKNAAASTGTSSALSAALKALGLNSSTVAGAAGLASILGAIGQYKQNAAYAPKFAPPALFGGAAGTTSGNTAGSASTGFGPAGGYNYKNYQGLTAGSPGLGYAPRSQVNANIPNYYTYGQNPQASFFTGTPATVTPATGATGTMQGTLVQPGPTAMARGGHVTTPQRYDAGGMVPMMQPPGLPATGLSGAVSPGMRPNNQTLPPAPGNNLPPSPAMPQRPMGGGPGMQMRPVLPPAMGGRPMMHRADGGSTLTPPPQVPQATSQTTLSRTSPLSQIAMRKAGANGPHPYASGGNAPPGVPPQQSVSRHVKGPGDGTSDSIPARLANGEYVIDAQTVSMLGNGDNGAGAKQLDGFREHIRKHKGAALAKGKMAPDAKQPQQYLPPSGK